MAENGKTLHHAVEMLERYWRENSDAETPVVRYLEPEALRERFDVSLGAEGVALDALLPLLESYLRYSVRTGHPQFFNQLFSGSSRPSLLGDLFSSATNTSMYTYEVAPVATLMELELIRKMNALIGFERGEGIFCTGGSNANMIGVLCARHRAYPEIKREGYGGGEPPAIFVSDQAHYSFGKAANLLGIGTDHVVEVRTDSDGRMIPEQLELEIRISRDQGKRPMLVGATAGTTVLGAFDPLVEIAAICSENDLWLHVDGAWGAPVLLSENHRHLVHGIGRADSVTWDAHKMMGASLTCTAFLTKHRGTLLRACGTDAEGTDYLFHETTDSVFDLGKLSLQCGRRVDALRLWLMWKHHGDEGLAGRVDRLFELAGLAADRVAREQRLELVAPRQSLSVCFRYLPEGGDDPNQVNLALRERLRKSGRSLVNFSHLRRAVALRLVMGNPELSEADVDRFFDQVLETAGEVTGARR